MEDSVKMGFVAVFAVSGSVVFLAMQAHTRLLSDFIKKIEFEMNKGSVKREPKKKVRFSDDVAESTVKKSRDPPRAAAGASRNTDEKFKGMGMPQNWQALYKGILQHRRGTNRSN